MCDTVNVYGIRKAGVFMMSLSSWLRTSLMHRAWPLLTIALAGATRECRLLPVSNADFPSWYGQSACIC